MTGIAVAFALLIAAVPATAGAATLYNEGVPAEEGSTVTMKSYDFAFSYGGGAVTVACKRFELHGIVTVNSGGNVVVAPDEEESVLVGCSANGAPMILTPELEEINLSGSTGTASFILTGPGITEYSVSAVSWVGPDAEEAYVEGVATGTLLLSLRAHFTFTTEDEAPLTLT